MRKIDFYFDFLSPFAYLARHRIEELASQYQCEISYKPIDLAAAKKAIGNTGPTNRELPVKLKYLIKDFQRWANFYGIPISAIKNHNSRLLNIGTFFAKNSNQLAKYVEVAYRKTWGEGGAPDDTNLLKEIARELNWNEEDFMKFINSLEGESIYKASTDNAIEKGIFGVPMIIVDDQMWWGNDRFNFVEGYLSGCK